MKKNDIQIIISHLSGFIRGAEFIDSSLLTGIVTSEFNINNINRSLVDYYASLIDVTLSDNQKYEFDNIQKIDIKKLQSSMESYFFQSPFKNKSLENSDIISKVRFDFVFRVIDLINMIRNCNDNLVYSSQMKWYLGDSIYIGKVYIFPLNKNNSILLKTVRLKTN